MRVAVTGATGVIGRFIVDDLLARGLQVIALSRPTSDRSGFGAGLQWVTGRLQDAAALEDLLFSADALVHCAFDHLPGRYRGGEGDSPLDFWQKNFMGTLNLLEAAHQQRLKRVILLSSRAVFGGRFGAIVPSAGPVLDDAVLHPDTHYGALKAATEALASAFSAQGLSCTSLRPTGVYGLSYPVSSSKWFDLARQATENAPAPAERIAGEVHGVDVASATHLLLTARDQEVSGLSFNCSDVVVSRCSLYKRMQELVQGGEALTPAHVAEPLQSDIENLMNCDGLRGLGWQPGGVLRLQESIVSLLAAANNQQA